MKTATKVICFKGPFFETLELEKTNGPFSCIILWKGPSWDWPILRHLWVSNFALVAVFMSSDSFEYYLINTVIYGDCFRMENYLAIHDTQKLPDTIPLESNIFLYED